MRSGGLELVDWVLIGVYGLTVLAIGYYYSRRQETTQEYFTGGGAMSPFLIGISLFVTLLSTISYLAQPGEMIKHGPGILAGLLGIPFSYLIVGYWLLPALMRRRVTSVYELLEERLGISVRLLGASMFLALRLVWMMLLIYLTSSALATILGVDERWVPLIAVACGFVSIIYTSLGGMRAVVVTDFLQFLLLFGGLLLTIGIITAQTGGFDWVPTKWEPTWDHQPFFSLNPEVRVTVVGAILASVVAVVAGAGGDQTMVQRFMSTRDAAAARRSFLIKSIAAAVVLASLGLLGFALLGYFKAFPESLPAGMDLVRDADKIFPIFISQFLPTGAAGLLVAAMFAAAMSSMDSGLNSITAVIQTDFIDRFRKKPWTDQAHLNFTRILALGIGVVVVAGSSLMGYVPGNFFEVTNKTVNLFVGPLFVLVFLALFIPFATGLGAIVGSVCGIATAVAIGYWDLLTGRPGLSFQWIGVMAVAVNIVVSCAVSWLVPRRRQISPAA